MISKKYLKGLEMDTLEELFEYIRDSYVNGQHSQVRQIVRKMSTNQYNQFIIWLHDNYDILPVFLRSEEQRIRR